MFLAIPGRYDLINHIITFGLDWRWRRLAVSTCLEGGPQRILDIGCGTGDLAIGLARRTGEEVAVKGLDYSPPMLVLARAKADQAGVAGRIEFVHGDATELPFPDAYFDTAGISFAFRNLTYQNPGRQQHLAEVFRVLRPGGRYVIVESSQPGPRFIRAVCHLYLRTFVAPVGTWLSGNRGAYRYLAESARRFYTPEEVREMLLAAGFARVGYRPLFFGAAGIHIATR
jgi:demethylmenaquinone methyltransferase/2-methoxy-6-polyprenyl-1,4-benzoquinol methylase